MLSPKGIQNGVTIVKNQTTPKILTRNCIANLLTGFQADLVVIIYSKEFEVMVESETKVTFETSTIFSKEQLKQI